MQRVLGVDGGGTKTIARVMAIGPSGRLCTLATGTSGASNPGSVGWEAATAAIDAAVSAALQTAASQFEADAKPLASAVLAIAGCNAPEPRQRMEAALRNRGYSTRLKVISDAEPLTAHLPVDQAAIAVIAGTGSVALVRPTHGATLLVGGWGFLLDDAGSGFGIGRDALRVVAQQLDQGDSSGSLTKFAFGYTNSTDGAGLKSAVYGAENPRQMIAGFARHVLAEAATGDSDAKVVVAENAAALAQLVVTARDRLPDAEPSSHPTVILAGGLLEKSAAYRQQVISYLGNEGWPPTRVSLAPDAASNCGLLACRLLQE